MLGTRISKESISYSRPHSVGPSDADDILNMNNPRPRIKSEDQLSGDHGLNLGLKLFRLFKDTKQNLDSISDAAENFLLYYDFLNQLL